MTRPDYEDYYVARAEASRDAAQRAATPAAAALHTELATRYDLLIIDSASMGEQPRSTD